MGWPGDRVGVPPRRLRRCDAEESPGSTGQGGG